MNPRGFPPRRPRIRENVNEAIRAREVRAVFPDGTVEVMSTLAAIHKAKEMGLDLILIAATAEPPVASIGSSTMAKSMRGSAGSLL